VQPWCPICALPSSHGVICGSCQKDPPHFDSTAPLFAYVFPVDRLVQELKYRSSLPLAAYLAAEFLTHLESAGIDCIVPMPLHPSRLKQRGFNQAQELARPLARQLGLPLLASACTRCLDSAPQASLPWRARQRNVRGAFACSVDLTGRSVAVVDDVMTTGATLNELARTLKLHGARRVTNWIAARTLKD
jgi:ComF family protein